MKKGSAKMNYENGIRKQVRLSDKQISQYFLSSPTTVNKGLFLDFLSPSLSSVALFCSQNSKVLT